MTIVVEARLSTFGRFEQIKFCLKLNWCDLDYFFFFSGLWVTMEQNDLIKTLQT